MKNEELERWTFLLTLTLVSCLFLYLLKPFFAPILWACIIAILFHPMQIWLQKKLGEHHNTTALITLTACVFLVVIPVLLLLTTFLQQGIALYKLIDAGEIQPAQYIDRIRQAFPAVQDFLERVGVDITSLRENATKAALATGSFLTQNAVAVGVDTFNFLLKLALMLYIAFFLLRDGRTLIEKLVFVIPLGDDRERLLFRNIAGVARATVKGNLVVAMVQGALGGIIFWILDIPAPLLWGVIMAVFSLIPAVGAGLIWLPAAIYLYADGQWIAASVLIAYGILIIGLADNVLRPILVGRDTKLPDWMVLLSTLGGIGLFGINGFVVGPLIAVLFVAFWRIFGKDFNTGDTGNDAQQPETGANTNHQISINNERTNKS
ncbi:Predicted PurR-regulated permease PerM [Nitrosomonas sp. Nm51]|uniref:AI-2E family transporter n=1 Tax=Nitrosomonas sp. Nm51 TaxID=133720 RepID=UPI0008D45A76|nr:AI-2E family transporter [Nitrosomonas sp. Nm51]SEQ96899.1 Predicted PurR-regulated permease PerM [Nitrosomonas sp. Nm51]